MSDELEIFGIILASMGNLHRDLIPEEDRSVIQRFIVEQSAKKCIKEIASRFDFVKKSVDTKQLRTADESKP